MANRPPPPAGTDRIERLCRDHVGDERALRLALLGSLRATVAFDRYAWLSTDPETEVGSAPIADVPAIADLPRLIRAKYLTPVNRWTGCEAGAATLATATGGAPERSLVWREVLSRYGVVDVASLVFRDAHGCWGWLDLWRSGSAGPFDDREVAILSATVPPITAALRRAQAATFEHAAASPERTGPVAMILSPGLEVKAQTAETQRYLRALVPPDGDSRPVPAGAYNVAAQLLAVEAGVDDRPPRARVHLADGVWLTLRAARADAARPAADHDVAVTIEPASPPERRDLFARCHGLSPRETEVLDHLAGGGDTRTIAAALFVSQHTVQDHLKSIFAKAGTNSRRELLARCAGR